MKQELNQVVHLDKFREVFSKLKQVDDKKTNEIITALNHATAETHQGIKKAQGNRDQLKYWLYREIVEIKAHTSSYLSYSETMATREASLWKFGFNVTEQFFELVFNGLDDYFSTKKQIMIHEVESKSAWHSTITDSSKKLIGIVNYSKKILKTTSKKVGKEYLIDDQDLINTHSLVEGILEKHLRPENVGRDVSKILELAQEQIKIAWEKHITAQVPDLIALKAFTSQATAAIKPTVSYEVGLAEHTLAVGMSGAVVGTIGLAAGWHTLTYSLLHVFPPLAIFSALAAVGMAVFTKEKAKENRRAQIIKAVNNYHQYFLLQIDTAHLQELNGKTLREALLEQSQIIVQETLRKWEEMISGNLKAEHYRWLIASTIEHIKLVENCLNGL